MSYLSKNNGFKIDFDTYLCKIVFVDGHISYHLFDNFVSAKKYSESVSKKYSCVSYTELTPFTLGGSNV